MVLVVKVEREDSRHGEAGRQIRTYLEVEEGFLESGHVGGICAGMYRVKWYRGR